MSIEHAIEALVERCPGARGAAVMDLDGIPVVARPRDAGLEELGAELASILRDVDRSAREFQHGALRQVSVTAENAVVVLTAVAAGYFLMLVLGADGLAGKARFLSRLTGERLHADFI